MDNIVLRQRAADGGKISLDHEVQKDKLVVLLAEDAILLRLDIAAEFRRLGCQAIA